MLMSPDIGADINAGFFTGAVRLVLFQPALSPSIALVTNEVTVLSCGPEVTNCPLRNNGPPVITSTVQLSITVCPVTLTQTRVASYTTPASASTNIPTDINQLISARQILDPTSIVPSNGVSDIASSAGGDITALSASVGGPVSSLVGNGASQASSVLAGVTSALDNINAGSAPTPLSASPIGPALASIAPSDSPGGPGPVASPLVTGPASLASGVPALTPSAGVGQLDPSVMGTLSYTYNRTISFSDIASLSSAPGPIASSGPAPSFVLDPNSPAGVSSGPINPSAGASLGPVSQSGSGSISGSASDSPAGPASSTSSPFTPLPSGSASSGPQSSSTLGGIMPAPGSNVTDASAFSSSGVPSSGNNSASVQGNSIPMTGNSTSSVPEAFLGAAVCQSAKGLMAVAFGVLAIIFAL